MPDWLKGAGPQAAAADRQPAASSDDAGDDDWLNAAPGDAPGDDLPDWLKDAGPQAIAPSPVPQDESLDWLAGEETSASPEPGLEWLIPTPADAAQDDWLAGESLDWLAGAEAGEPDLAADAPEPPGKMPDWMAEFAGSLPDGAARLASDGGELDSSDDAAAQIGDSAMSLPAFAFDGAPAQNDVSADNALPEWLAHQDESDPSAAAGGADELKAGELPSWLQAMRPVGLAGPAAEEEVVALAGPLSGLSGLLPAEANILQIIKPPTYSSRLSVSEPHQQHSELLASLVEDESVNPPLPGRPVLSSLAVLRVAMAFLLIFPVALALWTGMPNTGLPFATPEVKAAFDVLNTIQPGAPVLVVIDYDMSVSGEMDKLTGSAIQQLAAQGAYLAMVSSVVTGPGQAEHVLGLVRDQHGVLMAYPQNYVNLGLIPGGAAGLRGFAANPRRILPFDVAGAPAWENPAISAVTMPAQFALVLLATDSPETARTWFEQVQPGLAGVVPLVVLSSAQSEAFIRPYYDAGQAQGLVSGLAGSAALEQAFGASGGAAQVWPAFGVGMLISAVLMLMAGLYNFSIGKIARRKDLPGGEKKL